MKEKIKEDCTIISKTGIKYKVSAVLKLTESFCKIIDKEDGCDYTLFYTEISEVIPSFYIKKDYTEEEETTEEETTIDFNNNNKNEMTMNNSNNNSAMANNGMNMKNIFPNIEIGQVKGDDFKLSLDGIAVKSEEGNYCSYKDGEITIMDGMVFDCGQFFAMPVSKPKVGDLIKTNKIIGYVKSIENGITISDIKSNEIKTIMPSKNLFGLSYYTKIVSMMDMFNDEKDSSIDPMLMMFMMNGQGQGDNQMMQTIMLMNMMGAKSEMNELLPLLMMSQGNITGNNNNPMANMMPLMLMQGEDGKMDMKDMMFMSMMSQQNGNDSNQMNPMLMMFMMKGKKEGSKMNKMLPMLMMSQGNEGGSNGMAQMMMMQFLSKVEKGSIKTQEKEPMFKLSEEDINFIKNLKKGNENTQENSSEQ